MTILTEQYDFKNVDWTIAAGGDARDGTTSVQLTDVSGDVKFAFLYWGELNFSGSSDNNITVNGMSVSGERLGTSVDTCWGSDHSIGYFADVSDLVSGNGTFDIAGMGEGGQGASLVVFYDDGDVTNLSAEKRGEILTGYVYISDDQLRRAEGCGQVVRFRQDVREATAALSQQSS